MNEKNPKLFVFDKNEVFLLFIFVILIACISFVLGLRMGKGLSLKEDGYTSEDILKVDLKSVAEENVEDTLDNVDSTKPVELDTESRLKEEMEKLANDNIEIQRPTKAAPVKKKAKKQIESAEDVYNQDDGYSGKFTIQLYSHQNKAMAQSFADVFILKGYDIIINEVVIPGKGKWYRVSVGAFDDINAAKDYLNEESELFQGKNYIIKQI